MQVKWEQYARQRFRLIFGWYAIFVFLFTAWTFEDVAADPEGTKRPTALGVSTLVSIVPLLFCEIKQAYKAGLRTHFTSGWNALQALILIGAISIILLAEVVVPTRLFLNVSECF